MMQIWVDADACPVVIKQILYKAAQRWQIRTCFVANQMLMVPTSPYIFARQVERGFDVADDYIVAQLKSGDLVITGDIPLAAEVLDKQGLALNPRGELYSTETIKEKLIMRDMMDTLRSCGIETEGPKAFNHADRKSFANQLDTLLARHAK